ncbi:hypothetical protein VCHA34P126_10285 [Vibrio chagasii]|nr:hypothetical protein VCHA27O13_10279 [Vibrio chagasii]CAH6851584.1 hypothetical protein VCHA34P126_10285 [Vibrio chagasii]CAH6857957.1 hypothetical protein VCHA31O71_10840 [Vibrio chagasii]CAH7047218.1 hypothetical protein VCHA41O249_10281 [Vibrio chagasii]CAH7049029.1 hypothetical protein VCHA40O231_10570 [Vibrio chagasii]
MSLILCLYDILIFVINMILKCPFDSYDYQCWPIAKRRA